MLWKHYKHWVKTVRMVCSFNNNFTCLIYFKYLALLLRSASWSWTDFKSQIEIMFWACSVIVSLDWQNFLHFSQMLKMFWIFTVMESVLNKLVVIARENICHTFAHQTSHRNWKCVKQNWYYWVVNVFNWTPESAPRISSMVGNTLLVPYMTAYKLNFF